MTIIAQLVEVIMSRGEGSLVRLSLLTCSEGGGNVRARAILCAEAIVDSVRPLGLEVRSLHTGEVELSDGNVAGIAVHIGARVAAQAEGGEVLVSGTVKDLVAGSGLEFEDCGATTLKGISGEWRLFAVRASRSAART